MATPDAIRATINRYLQVFTEGDREGYLDLFTADATVEDPIGSEIHHGHEAIAAFWDTSRSLADHIELQLSGPACVAGHEAAFPMSIVSTLGGSKVALDAIDVMTFDDGARITSMRAYWDMAEMRPVES